MISEVTRISPAKINLYLEVKNRRKDGYHNIKSLMTFCDFGDQISVIKSKKFNLKVQGPFSKFLINKENLIEKSIRKMEDLYERDFKVQVILKKNLPIASGMAGGSSNAATFILCVKEIFGLKIIKGFDQLLLSLGADVPFCFFRKTALVSGIGENLTFTKKLKEYFILLVNPQIEISTREIFSNLIINKDKKNKNFNNKIANTFITKSNDLEPYVIKKHEIIGEILSHLSNCQGSVINRMTGSGATCFALFENFNDLERAEVFTKKVFKSCWIKKAKLSNSVKHL